MLETRSDCRSKIGIVLAGLRSSEVEDSDGVDGDVRGLSRGF